MAGEQQQDGTKTRRKRYEPPTEEAMEYGKRFAAWLRATREMRGLNKKQLADKAGISPTWIGVLENDGIENQSGALRRPTPRMVRKIATALETDASTGLRAAGLPVDDAPATREFMLPTGDTLEINPEDTEPDLTAAAVGAFLLTWRKSIRQLGKQGGQVGGLPSNANN